MLEHLTYEQRMTDGQEVGYYLLAILLHIAPTSDAQRSVTEMYAQFTLGQHKERDKTMICALADGFLYGNWPWATQDERYKHNAEKVD